MTDMNANRIRERSQRIRQAADDGGAAAWEFCQVEAVDTDTMTVAAYFLRSKKRVTDVPFAFPYLNGNRGILFLPEVGAIGLAAWVHQREPYILAFVVPPVTDSDGRISARQADMEKLNPGEILLYGSGFSFVKLDALGGVMMSTPRYHFIALEEQRGIVRINCERYLEQSESGTVYKGVGTYLQNGMEQLVKKSSVEFYTTEIEHVYETADNLISSYSTAEALANAINQAADVGDVTTPQVKAAPIITISKGNVIDAAGTLAVDPDTGAELCFEARVDRGGQNRVRVTVDKTGHVAVLVGNGVKATITGDATIAVTGNVNITAGGSLLLQGKDFLTHTHTASADGGTTSGVN